MIKKNLIPTAPQWISILIVMALVSSLFYQGFEIEFFTLSQLFLMLWMGIVFWHCFDQGISVSKNLLVLLLSLFWLWLLLTLLWSPVPYLSVFNLWWIGTLVLVFWLYTLTHDNERLIFPLGLGIVLIGCALAGYAMVQFFLLQQAPRSVFLNINLHAALLNLIAIALTAYLFRAAAEKKPKTLSYWVLCVVLFVLVFAVAVTNSRGAALSLILGLLLLSVLCWRSVPKSVLGGLGLVVIAALLLPSLTWGHRLTAYLADPAHTDTGRLVIWASAWQLVKLAPLLGHGLGTFSLLYPRFRPPMDRSTDYFAHNDYLQIWIEAGLPAILLLLSILLVVLTKFIRMLGHKPLAADVRIEAAGWFSALFAIALHSLVTFNFYVLTTLIISGLMLGRLSQIFDQHIGVRYWHLQPKRYFSKAIYRVVIVALLLLPVTYLASITLSIFETDRAHAFAKVGLLKKADKSFYRAARFYPYADNIMIGHADLYRHVIKLLPAHAQEAKREMYNRSLKFLHRAEALNPLRPLNFLVRGQLYEQNPTLAGRDWRAKAARSYQQALALNPRFFLARAAHAAMLLKRGRIQQSHRLLEDGLNYWYPENRHLIPYLLLTAKLREKTGDRPGAKTLQQKARRIAKTVGWRLVPNRTNRRVELPTTSTINAVVRPIKPGK